jgi:hypothetical protein
MIFQHTPDPLNGIVFAVIGGIIGQFYVHILSSSKLHEPFQELGSTTLGLGPVIHIQHEGMGMKSSPQLWPQVFKSIANKISGDDAFGEIEPEIIGGGGENPK